MDTQRGDWKGNIRRLKQAGTPAFLFTDRAKVKFIESTSQLVEKFSTLHK